MSINSIGGSSHPDTYLAMLQSQMSQSMMNGFAESAAQSIASQTSASDSAMTALTNADDDDDDADDGTSSSFVV